MKKTTVRSENDGSAVVFFVRYAAVLFDHSECLRTDGKNTVFQADIAELEQHIAAEFLRKIRR